MEDATDRKVDDRSITVTRRLDDRSTAEDRRPISSSDYPWQSASSQHFHPSIRTVPDSFAQQAFNGTNTDADTWLARFQRCAEYRDRDITAIFPLFLKDSAIGWYDTLFADFKNDLESLRGNFKAYFGIFHTFYIFHICHTSKMKSCTA